MPEPAGAVAGVVLAAGRATRMGRNKLLLEAGGEALVRRTVRSAVEAGLHPVLVVLGHEADRVAAALDGLPWMSVVNPNYDAGVNASLRAGLARVPADHDAAIVLLADMPFVTSAMIKSVAARHRDTKAALVISDYAGTQAPPTLYGRELFGELAAAEGEEGAGKEVVRRHRPAAAVVSQPAEALADIDRPDEYRRLVGLLDAPT